MNKQIDNEGEAFTQLREALQSLSLRCKEAEGMWLLGGSSALWLQGVQLHAAPRDIDVYVDRNEADVLHHILRDTALDEPRLDTSGCYVSQLSHYRLNGMPVELVGGFEIKTEGGHYRTEVTDTLAPSAPTAELGEATLRLMPLAHEFIFNVLRSRPDRYLAIAEVIRRDPKRHMPLLFLLLKRNRWTSETIITMAELLNEPLLSADWGVLGE